MHSFIYLMGFIHLNVTVNSLQFHITRVNYKRREPVLLVVAKGQGFMSRSTSRVILEQALSTVTCQCGS